MLGEGRNGDLGHWHCLRTRTGNDVSYLHADHLQSTTDTTGDENSGPQLYFPYGETRSSAEVATEYQYTGQRWQDELGLYYYNARWYDPQMRRFVQADTLVPEPGNPQSLNRYSYCLNNPIRYMDPTGHDGGAWGAIGMDNPYSVVGQRFGLPDSSEWGVPSREVQSLTTDAGRTYVQAVDAANKVLGPVVEVGLGAIPGIGLGMDLYELVTGETIFGEQVSPLGRGIAALGVFTFVDEAGNVIKLTGQLHHPFSKKILDALEEHDTLQGVFRRRDVTVRARDIASHYSYDDWHRGLDNQIVDWLDTYPTASTDEFLSFLEQVYSTPDMIRRFPGGREAVRALRERTR